MSWVPESFRKSLITVRTSRRSLRYNFTHKIHTKHGSVQLRLVPDHLDPCSRFPKRSDLARLSVDLLIETVLLKRRLNVRWICESGLVKNIDRVVEEYRQTRRLLVRRNGSFTGIYVYTSVW